MREKILIVEDDKNMRNILKIGLEGEKYDVLTASNGLEAKKIIDEEEIELIISDLKMGKVSGMELLKWVKKKYEFIPFIMITAYATVENAIEAMKLGASDYIMKPFKFENLLGIVKDNLRIKRRVKREYSLEKQMFIGSSEKIKKLLNDVDKVAKTDANVLIYGETGVGKELIANMVHQKSLRAKYPLIKVNCPSIPSELFESELFGHKKGAYTHAYEDKPGKFELADKGTIFLDEISTLNPALQSKLLRVIQEGELERIGETKTIKVDVRIISATNVNLLQAIKNGTFREDLYFRLKVVELIVPPLREHKEDINELIDYFLKSAAEKYNLPLMKITDNARKKIISYDWPGNIRELKHCIEQSIILCEKHEIDAQDIIIEKFADEPEVSTDNIESIDEIQKRLIINALKKVRGNKTKAANLLGLTRSALRYRIEKYGVEDYTK